MGVVTTLGSMEIMILIRSISQESKRKLKKFYRQKKLKKNVKPARWEQLTNFNGQKEDFFLFIVVLGLPIIWKQFLGREHFQNYQNIIILGMFVIVGLKSSLVCSYPNFRLNTFYITKLHLKKVKTLFLSFEELNLDEKHYLICVINARWFTKNANFLTLIYIFVFPRKNKCLLHFDVNLFNECNIKNINL